MPARVPERQAKVRVKRVTRNYPSMPRPAQPDEREARSVKSEPRVDLNAMELSFEDDGLNELPGVVRSFNGVFALIDKGDPSFARYILEPPNWTIKEVTLDLSGRLRFTMTPADKWAVLREAAQRYGLDLHDYNVSALFEGTYAKCLQQAIRERAMAADAGANRRVKSARLAFASGKSCGIEVVSISTASTL